MEALGDILAHQHKQLRWVKALEHRACTTMQPLSSNGTLCQNAAAVAVFIVDRWRWRICKCSTSQVGEQAFLGCRPLHAMDILWIMTETPQATFMNYT